MTTPGTPEYCNPVDNGVGAEYNPLTEVGYYGTSNPYQDPKRGAIDTVEGNGCSSCSEDNDVALEQFDLLQNLEDLIGRSVTVSDNDSGTIPLGSFPYIVACC